ncbi:hypothetical protein BB560_006011, partial [Smittium megazygosporum]
MAKDPKYKVRFAPQLAKYLKEKPLISVSKAVDAASLALNTGFSVVVSSPVIKIESPDFLLSSSPGPDVENTRPQLNEMYDQAYTTINQIDFPSKKLNITNKSKLLLWNIDKLSSDTVKEHLKHVAKDTYQQFKVNKVKQYNK